MPYVDEWCTTPPVCDESAGMYLDWDKCQCWKKDDVGCSFFECDFGAFDKATCSCIEVVTDPC